MAVRATPDEVHRVISTAVDPAFYRAVNPDLDRPEIDPVRHYVQSGWREGRDPAPWFSNRGYLAANRDVARSGIEPLYHYLTVGRREGREVPPSQAGDAYLAARLRPAPRVDVVPPSPPGPDPEPVTATAPPPGLDPSVRAVVAAEFDEVWYRLTYFDLWDTDVDPLDHFLEHGWREGRDPGPKFSTNDYLEIYADIREAGLNPFVHYVTSGRAEGRTPRHDLGWRHDVIMGLKPVAERMAKIRAAPPPELGTAEALEAALADSRTGLRDLHITFSHDDYTRSLGGMQQCIQREDDRAGALGRDHLHLHPVKIWEVVRTSGEKGELGVVLNGQAVGAFAPRVVAQVLGDLAGAVPAGERSFAIHSLLGHRADETVAILRAAGLKAGLFWLHDYASLCAGFHLLRNDVQDCAAPPPDSPACSVCAYLPMRGRHLEEHEKLFRRLDLTVVSPSPSALELWRSSWTYPAKAEVVLPHARLVERGPAPVARGKRPLRIAHAGLQHGHKGWPVFRALALEHRDDPRYAFLHLGAYAERGLPVEFHEVVASRENPAAMRQALEENEVDVVLLWPLWRETFSLVAYEAVAAGCAIVTNPDSGNIAAFVEQGGHGWVLPDEAALEAAIAGGGIQTLARKVRKPGLYDLAFTDLSFDVAAS
jgi:hypothetical protein